MIRLDEHAESIDRLAVEVAKLTHRAEQAEAELARLSPLLIAVGGEDTATLEDWATELYNRGCAKPALYLERIAAARVAM